MSVWKVYPCAQHYKPNTCLDDKMTSPFATRTYIGVATWDYMLVLSRNDELTKLWELPESTKISITLFRTMALTLIELPESVLDIAFSESCPIAAAKVSSISSWLSVSSVSSTPRSLTTRALT
jgi:hypothetical protein